MNKKILTTVILVGVLATGAFAYNRNCQNGGQRGMVRGQFSQQGMQQRGMKKGLNHRVGMQMFANLNLSNDQQFKLSILKDEMRLEMRKIRGTQPQARMINFIGANGFDKKSFMKETDSMQTKMTTIKANHMEKVFKILTEEQVSQLKKNLNS